MMAGPNARLDAAYLLGVLDADERLSYEAHLVTCWRCRTSLTEISAIAPLLAGLDESVLATPPEAAPTPVPDTLLPRLLKAAGRERARRPRRRRRDLRPGQLATHPRPESHLHQRHRTHRDTDQEPPDQPAQRARHPHVGGGPPLQDRRSLVRPAGRSRAPANRRPALATGQDGPGESRKVAGVVDAMDGGKSTVVPLDLVNAGGTEI
jgi:anti-sigma factor RsiW